MVTIREVTADDIPQILQFQEDLYSLNFKSIILDEQFYSDMNILYSFAAFIKNDFYSFVLEEKGKIEGFYLFSKQDIDLKTNAYLMQLYVSEKLRSQKYGAKLMEHFEEHAKSLGCTDFSLHVSDINEKAVQFYEKFNYETLTFDYDHNGDPRHFMKKEIA